jgi:hypothetical protein
MRIRGSGAGKRASGPAAVSVMWITAAALWPAPSVQRHLAIPGASAGRRAAGILPYQPQKAIVPPVQQVAHSETRGHEIGQGFGIGLGM